MKSKETLILIDGNSLANRAFYGVPFLTAEDGRPSNAVYGMANMVIRLIQDYSPTYMAVAFDLKAPTFRHKMYDAYKGTRKGMPDDLASQMPMIKDLLVSMGITIVERKGLEADDILGCLATQNSVYTIVVTGDRDCLQLVSPSTEVLITKRGITDTQLVTQDNIVQLYNLTASQIIDYKSLAGDSSDNIPGVTGVGDKTATDLIKTYGDLDNIYANVDNLKGKLNEKLVRDREQAYLSHELATIKTDEQLGIELSSLTYDFPFSSSVMEMCKQFNLKSVIRRVELFASDVKEVEMKQVNIHQTDIKNIKSIASRGKAFAFATYGDSVSIAVDDKNEYTMSTELTLLSNNSTLEEIILELKSLFEDKSYTKYFYDAKKYVHMCRKVGVKLVNYEDIALMEYLALSVPSTSVTEYAVGYGYENAPATCVFARRHQLAVKLIEYSVSNLYYDIELKLIEVLADMEQAGFLLDLECLSRLASEYEDMERDSATKIKQLAGKEFNVNSPKQLAVVLFEDLGLPYPKKGRNRSTSAEILSELSGEPIVAEVLRYRFIAKMRSTYIEGLKRVAKRDGSVHTEFKQMLTGTGRLSSVEPNLQNIPIRQEEGKVLRSLFVAHEGNVLVSADYSQIELRIMAHLSNDAGLVNAYKNGDDIHTTVASELYYVPPVKVTSSMRRVAKTVNFGIIYGISAFGLSSRLGISNFKAKEMIESYFDKYPAVKEYLDKVVEDAKEVGWVSSMLGRRRFIPELKMGDLNRQKAGARMAMNMPLQSSAADIIKVAMLRVWERLQGTTAKLILQVHDELIIECPEEDGEKVKQILAHEMEKAVTLSVPLTVSTAIGKNWLECK